MITSQELRFIKTIAEHKTLASVARSLNVTAPSVTQRLQKLEAKLAIKIIQRPSKVVSLTDEGIVLYRKGMTVLSAIDDIHSELDQRKNQVLGCLKILAPLGFGNDYVAPLLAEYNILHPKLHIELTLSDTPHWADNHKWDLVIYIGELNDSSLKRVVLAENKRFICASPNYLKKNGKPNTPSDLVNHRCISLKENNEDVTLWQFTHKNSKKTETFRVTPTLVCNEGSVVKAWALQGLGIIHRSEWDVQPQINSGQLVKLLPDHSLPSADIVALLNANTIERSARVNGFLTLLKQRLALKPWANSLG